MKKRRATSVLERLTPCHCCKYPVSQRHHLLEFAEYGESQYTRQLCANCHELFHIVDRAFADTSNDRAMALLDTIVRSFGSKDPRITYMAELVNLVRQARHEVKNQQAVARVFSSFFGER